MSVKTNHLETEIVYFCTFTCFNWTQLFHITNFYNRIYDWFDIITSKNCQITGYVIMPNHLHFLIYIPNNINLNNLVGNGKRFMAYEIVKILGHLKKTKILKTLSEAVPHYEIKKGKKHMVFQPSFDAKPCVGEKFLIQKLDYMHHNPVSGKWNLVEDYTDYEHSSASFYELDKKGIYPVIHYQDIIG